MKPDKENEPWSRKARYESSKGRNARANAHMTVLGGRELQSPLPDEKKKLVQAV